MTPEHVTLTVGDLHRRYLLFQRAAGFNPAVRLPLVIFLHGTGGTATWAEGETRWSATAAQENFLLAVPDAMPPNRQKPSKFLTNPQRWNDGSPLTPPVDDVAFLSALIADAVDRFAADPNRVYVTGFSNGAGMAFRFAAERADLIAAVAPVAGYNPVRGHSLARPVPTLFVLGTADPLIPEHGGPVRLPWGDRRVTRHPVSEGLSAWATGLGCSPTPVVESNTAGVRTEVYPGAVEFRAMYIEGLGHHWPGGRGQFDERFGGPPSDRVNGNELVWRFLSQWRR